MNGTHGKYSSRTLSRNRVHTSASLLGLRRFHLAREAAADQNSRLKTFTQSIQLY